MTTPLLARTATTEAPILDVLAERWSPRAFDESAIVDESALAAALEAARWAPSAYNVQPWRFVVARRGSAVHAQIHDALIGFNQTWAGNAAVFIVAIAETTKEDGTPISHALYDLGQAVAHLSVQAHHDGLHVHQMSGFDADALRAAFDLEERFAPTTVLALGQIGDAATLPAALQEREVAPRARRPLAETVLANA
jgi:nitroreductase